MTNAKHHTRSQPPRAAGRAPTLGALGALALLACGGGMVGSDDDDPGRPAPVASNGGRGGAGANPSPAPNNPSPNNPSPNNPAPATPPGEAPSVTSLSTGALGELCKTPTVGPARLWRLSRLQLRNTLKATLGIDATTAQLAAFNDGTSGFIFSNEADSLRVRKTDAGSWAVTAIELSRQATTRLKMAGVCPDLGQASCAPRLVDHVGARLFRRPLRDAEKARYGKLYTDTLAGPMAGGDGAAQAVVSAMLQSPYFLYRTEIGKPVAGKRGLVRLTGHEVASALSYTLWQTSPDDDLARAAAAGELDTAEGIRKQAQRMAADDRFVGFYVGMLGDLSHAADMATREGADMVKDGDKVMSWFNAELQAFVGAVLADKPTFDELLSRRTLSLPGDGAVFRNLSTTKGTMPVAVQLAPPVAAGLLSLGAVAFANAGTEHPSPVKRGVMVRERFLCSPVPPPPEDVMMDFAKVGGDVVTNRQVYDKTTSPPLCSGCHRLINPIGYPFEAFDHLGKYRTMDRGQPVDLSGEIVASRDADGTFADLAGLAETLRRSKQASECFALNGFRYVAGRLESPGDLCHVNKVHEAFVKGGRDLRALAVELVASDAFVQRSSDN